MDQEHRQVSTGRTDLKHTETKQNCYTWVWSGMRGGGNVLKCLDFETFGRIGTILFKIRSGVCIKIRFSLFYRRNK